MDFPRPVFDERDEEIRVRRQQLFDERTGPRVGDFIVMANGALRRFTYDWGDDIQTTHLPVDAGNGEGFYLGNGYISYSGGLDPAIPKSEIIDTGETREGGVWFFHHDSSGAHRGVSCKITFRVYRHAPATNNPPR